MEHMMHYCLNNEAQILDFYYELTRGDLVDGYCQWPNQYLIGTALRIFIEEYVKDKNKWKNYDVALLKGQNMNYPLVAVYNSNGKNPTLFFIEALINDNCYVKLGEDEYDYLEPSQNIEIAKRLKLFSERNDMPLKIARVRIYGKDDKSKNLRQEGLDVGTLYFDKDIETRFYDCVDFHKN